MQNIVVRIYIEIDLKTFAYGKVFMEIVMILAQWFAYAKKITTISIYNFAYAKSGTLP